MNSLPASISPEAVSPGWPWPAADALLETLPWGLLLLGPDGTVQRLNRHAADWLGLAPAAVCGQPLASLAPVHLPASLAQALLQLLSGAAPPETEFFLPRHGQWITQTSARLADQTVIYWQDITVQKTSELALRQHQQLLQATFDASLDMIQVFEAVRDDAGRIVDFRWVLQNHVSQKFSGSAVGKCLLAENPGVQETGIFARMVEVVETGQPRQDERHYVHEQFDGWFWQSMVKLNDGVATTTTDISARKQTEQEMLRLKDELTRRATSKYQALFGSIEEGFAILEKVSDAPLDFRYVEVNPAFAEQAGVANATGRTVREVFPAEPDNWVRACDAILRTGEPLRFQGRLVAQQRTLDVYAFRVENGGRAQVAVVFADLTARKCAEENMRESQAQLQLAVQAGQFGTWHFNLAQQQLTASPRAWEIFGRAPQAAATSDEWAAAIYPDDRAATLQAFEDSARAGGVFSRDYRVLWPDGTVRWVSVTGQLSSDTAGAGASFNGLVADITARKEAEERLRLAAEQDAFRVALSDALRPLDDPAEIQATVPHMARRHFQADRCYYGEIADDAATIRRDAARPGLPSVAAVYSLREMPLFRAVLQAGRPVVVADVAASALMDDNLQQLCLQSQILAYINVPVIKDGKPVGIFCVTQSAPREWTAAEVALAQEIAERTWAAVERARAETALRESEERLRLATEAANLYAWEIDLRTGVPTYSDNAEQVIGGRPAASLEEALHRIHPDDRARVQASFAEAAAHDGRLDYETRAYTDAGELRWFRVSGVLVPNPQGPPTRALGVTRNITGRKRAHEALRQANERFQLAEEAANGFVYDWNPQTDVTTRSEGFGKVLGYAASAVPETGTAWLSLVHPDDRAPTQAAIEAALDGHEPARFAVEYRVRAHDGRYRYVLDRGMALRDEAGQLVRVVGSTVDITERKRTEAALSASEELLRAMVENLPGGAAFLVDRELRYLLAEGEALRTAGFAADDFVGKTIFEALAPDTAQQYETLYRQALAGDTFVYEHEINGNFYVSRGTPLRYASGEVYAVLAVSYDISDRKRAEEQLRKSERQLRIAVEAAEMGTWDWNLRTNEVYWNELHFELFGMTPRPGPLEPADFERHVHPDDRAWVMQRLQDAVAENRVFEAEFRAVKDNGETRWMNGYGQATKKTRAGETVGMSGVMLDVTARKQAQQELQGLAASLERTVARRTKALEESRTQLQAVFDSSLNPVMVFGLERDAAGQVSDFRYVLLNALAQRYEGGNPVGKLLHAEQHPDIQQTPIFAQLQAVAATGEPADFEVNYGYEGAPETWYRVRAVRMDADGLVVTGENITARRQAEQDLRKAFGLLQQAEDVASMGSWDYDRATGAFRWSAGMYRLFGLPEGSPVSPRTYTDFVLDEDRPVAERIVRNLTEGRAGFEETLRIRVGADVKILRIKAAVLYNEHGEPARVLGVDLDISEVQRLEQENSRMRLTQQQERIAAVLEAQEEERRRIAESLHNGLGQVLFATKLQLDQLTAAPQVADTPALAAARREADRLLVEAIRQTRTLSHELTPGIVAEFGLKAALHDICRSLRSPTLRWQCLVFFDDEQPLPLPLQVALYRLAQELTQNIVKHARARHATLEVETLPGWVVLRTEDDGQGFDPNTPTDGIGLKTLRHRVALLGGSVHLTSAPGQGTQLQIRIPLS